VRHADGMPPLRCLCEERSDVTIPIGMASCKTLPKMGLWSLALAGMIVEAIPLRIASDCSAGLRIASQRQPAWIASCSS